MAEREHFDGRTFDYRAATPTQDRRNHPALVPAGDYPRLIGIDGRYTGSFRRFPGFKKVVNLSEIFMSTGYRGDPYLYPPLGNTPGYTSEFLFDMSSMGNVWFFKPITVQVVEGYNLDDTAWNQSNGPDDAIYEGASFRIFRGFVVAHPSGHLSGAGGNINGGVVRFVYYDQEAGIWKSHALLFEFSHTSHLNNRVCINTQHADYGDGVILEDSFYDACAMGPFIYFTVARASPLGDNSDAVPGTFGTGNEGSIPRDYYRRSVRVSSSGSTVRGDNEYTSETGGDWGEADVTDDLEWAFTDLGPPMDIQLVEGQPSPQTGAIYGTTNGTLDGSVKTAVRMFSTFKNVEGPLVQKKSSTVVTTEDHLTITKDSTPPGGFKDVARWGNDDHAMRTKLRAYRSIDSATLDAADVGTLIPGTLFREQEVVIRHELGRQTIGQYNISDATYNIGSASPSLGNYDIHMGFLEDTVLVNEARVDPFEDDTAYVPKKVTLLLPYQGTLLRVGTFPRAAAPALTMDRDNILSWGSLRKYAPEECRVKDATPLGSDQDEAIIALVSAGDYAFAVGDSGVFRIHRNGKLLAINEIQSLCGGVGRWGAVGVGTALYYVSPTGVYVVDGATQEFQLLSSLDRVIIDDWKDTLGSIRMCYDNRLGALFIVNTDDDTQEALVLWANTGMITTLKDVPFKWVGQTVNPEDGGYNRSFWCTEGGVIYTPNSDRATGVAMTMCGGDSATYEWNHVLDSNSDTLNLYVYGSQGIDPDIDLTGFKVYFVTGANAGSSRVIASHGTGRFIEGPSAAIVLEEALDEAPEGGDVISLAPIPFEVVGWPLQDPRVGVDLFIAKTAESISHSVLMKGGEIYPQNFEYNIMVHKIYRRGDLEDGDEVLSTSARMLEDPDSNNTSVSSGSGYRGTLIYPGWRTVMSNLDFEWLGGRVTGSIAATEATIDPAD